MAALALETLWERSQPRQRCCQLTEGSEKWEPLGQVQGISPGQAATVHCSSGCKSPEVP